MTKIILVTRMGKIIKFNSEDVPTQNRKGIGVKAITLIKGDEVIAAFTEIDRKEFNEKHRERWIIEAAKYLEYKQKNG